MFPALSAARQKTDNQIYFFVQPLQHFSYTKTFSTKLFLIFRISSFSWRETFFYFLYAFSDFIEASTRGSRATELASAPTKRKLNSWLFTSAGVLSLAPSFEAMRDARPWARSAVGAGKWHRRLLNDSWSRQMTASIDVYLIPGGVGWLLNFFEKSFVGSIDADFCN